MGGPYCSTTPCGCDCHARKSLLFSPLSIELSPAMIAIGERAGVKDKLLEVGRYMSITTTLEKMDAMAKMRQVIRALLIDAIREDQAREKRAELVESRAGFALQALREEVG